jgi:hypothetical protein
MSTAPAARRLPEQRLLAHRVRAMVIPDLVQDLAAAPADLAAAQAASGLVQVQAARPPLHSSPSNENGLASSEATLRFNSERRNSKRQILDAKRGTATAGALRVRVLKLEACCFKGFHVIHHAAIEIHQRSRIDEHLEAVEGENLVHHS